MGYRNADISIVMHPSMTEATDTPDTQHGPARPRVPAATSSVAELEAVYGAWTSLPTMFFEQAAACAGRPLLHVRRNARWHALSWSDVAEQVRRAARGLRSLGLDAGDRVVIVSENRPEWLIADMAIMAAGAITVPAYTTAMPSDLLHVLRDSGARFAIVSTPALLRRLLPAALQAPALRALVTLDTTPGDAAPGDATPEDAAPGRQHDGGPERVAWDVLLARGADPGEPVEAWVAALGRDDPACIIYTSGTGGAPKGVMLSHANILANCLGAALVLRELGLAAGERFLSFLPLGHAYEHTAGQMFPLSIGAEIAYAESIDRLPANLADMAPTIMTAVPRLYDVLRSRILRETSRTGAWRRRLFERTLELGRRRYRQGGRLHGVESIEDRVLERLVRRKVRARFGGRLKAFVSGGAPLAPEMGMFFEAIGIRILQGYGQTEAAPLISVNPPTRVRHETVGPPVHGTGIRIAGDGEILVRGAQVMLGYWGDPSATERAIEDGWLHTGDIGRIEPDGYLVITDRKKDIIVTSGGDNVAPQRIENLMTLEAEIAQAVLAGDRRPYLVALVVPDREVAVAWARRHGKSGDVDDLARDPDFRKLIGAAVDRVNACLSGIERIRRFEIITDPFTIDNGLLTPTLKIRRQNVKQRYDALIDALYGR